MIFTGLLLVMICALVKLRSDQSNRNHSSPSQDSQQAHSRPVHPSTVVSTCLTTNTVSTCLTTNTMEIALHIFCGVSVTIVNSVCIVSLYNEKIPYTHKNWPQQVDIRIIISKNQVPHVL